MTRLAWVLFACLFFQPSIGNKLPDYQYDKYDYDYGDTDDSSSEAPKETVEKEVLWNPVILTESKNIVVDLGTTIRLPCLVDHLPKDIALMWKRPDAKTNQILAIGDSFQDQEFKSRANVEITEKGSVLNIGVATIEDAGQYECELGIKEPKNSLRHTVSIRVPPAISSHSETYMEAEKGQQVLLSCRGTGKPQPTVRWTKVGKGKLPGGTEEIVGEEFIIKNVNRDHSGVYRCTAGNGFSKEAHKDIELRVMYKPEIVVEEVYVHTKTGDKAEVVCNVHGMPRPKVEWRKDGQPITGNSKVKLENNHSRHSLIISSVERSDFGEYSCYASSEKGTASETLEISGMAKPAEFKSSARGEEPNSFLLEWTVASFNPVTAFRVETREEGTTAWMEHTAAPTEEGPYHYAGKLFLKDLKEATRYEARVSARNDEGWNRPKETFDFATKGADVEKSSVPGQRDPNLVKEPKQEGRTSSSQSIVPCLTLLLLSAARLF